MTARLSSYAGKRDFSRTPEPAPGDAQLRPSREPRFMVHKHDARRLHYDLRLEMDGALASWAVPKGPSYDPAERRLAVQTEDHPLEYGDFEGRIPDGEYGAGDSIIWDRGTYQTVPPDQASAMRRKGHLVIELNGEKLQGRWHLVRTRAQGGKQQWLLFKAHDEHENPRFDVVAERPESVVSGKRVTRGPQRASARRTPAPEPIDLLLRVWPPELAALSRPDAVAAGGYRFEVKYDGYRALSSVSGGRVAVQSRNGLDLAGRFPEVVRPLAALPVREAVLDGEIVATRQGAPLGMQELGTPGTVPRLFVFDLLLLDGEDLRARPLEDRLELLAGIVGNHGASASVRLAEELGDDVEKALRQARRRGLEGVMAKRRGSPYRGGRGRDWLKLKLAATQDAAIAGFTALESKAGKRDVGIVGALVLAVRDGDRLRYAGKVGTGMSDRLRRELWELLARDVAAEPQVAGAPRMSGVTWVEPKHVVEVAFTEWTHDGRLRHPTLRGLRPDKTVAETTVWRLRGRAY